MPRKLAAGNWKMNGLSAALSEIATLAAAHPDPGVDMVICPPATLISQMAALPGPVAVGAQDCHTAASGAHTGDLSAHMLKDAGATYVITGHSERRTDHGESDADVRSKTEAAWSAGLTAILCIGETEAQQEAGETLSVIGTQLAQSVPDGSTAENLVIAYEPVWAIGTGKVPTTSQIGAVHDFIRAELVTRFGTEIGQNTRILYGGSVKASNAADIFAVNNVDGALVGGASLKSADFAPIVAALDVADT
jgi:triosephosphate isomerase